jgi:flagellar assembly protein FliH
MEQGRTQELREQTELLERAAAALAEAMGEFRAERDQYLGAVEHEVVRLALAIAARVLHREAQMDPLLLSGAVRVALGQLAETAETRLRVPAAEEELWTQMLRLMPNLALRPELVADERLQAGDAVLEAQTGSVDLGVRAQLEEIERGFFDLLESREGVRGAVASGSIAGKTPGNRE